MLDGRGYEAVAVTGKAGGADYLESIGARRIAPTLTVAQVVTKHLSPTPLTYWDQRFQQRGLP